MFLTCCQRSGVILAEPRSEGAYFIQTHSTTHDELAAVWAVLDGVDHQTGNFIFAVVSYFATLLRVLGRVLVMLRTFLMSEEEPATISHR